MSVAGRSLDPADADDVAQEALIRAWKHRSQCRDPDRPWAWLRTVVAREIARHAAQRAHAPLPDVVDVGEPDHRLDAVLDRAALVAAMRDTTDPVGRAVLVLHHVGDMRVTDVARVLDVPLGTVKVKLARSRAALAVELGDDPPL